MFKNLFSSANQAILLGIEKSLSVFFGSLVFNAGQVLQSLLLIPVRVFSPLLTLVVAQLEISENPLQDAQRVSIYLIFVSLFVVAGLWIFRDESASALWQFIHQTVKVVLDVCRFRKPSLFSPSIETPISQTKPRAENALDSCSTRNVRSSPNADSKSRRHGRSRLDTDGTTSSHIRDRTVSNHTFEERDEEYFEFTPVSYWNDPEKIAKSNILYEYYYGPHCSYLAYDTWTPPPTWVDVSKQVFPLNHRLPLQRVIELQLASECTLRVVSSSGNFSSGTITVPSNPTSIKSSSDSALELPVQDISTHVEHAEGGVLSLYVKESSREEWMEHTFVSAAMCAQFQTDLLALQLLGSSIFYMYQAFEIIHHGSISCPAKELVLHDPELDVSGDELSNGVKKTWGQSKGIAWDDVMRSLGTSFPSIRHRLDALWWKQALLSSPLQQKRTHRTTLDQPTRSPTSTNEPQGLPEENLSLQLTEDYVKKRMLLGPIDFFRLFAPNVDDSAIPRVGVNPARVAQLLRWRKRVARASVMVQKYMEARVVVNVGWNLPKTRPESYWKRRLAFDENIDNMRWDSSKENEYYEPTVSRDVMVRVRGIESLRRQPRWRFGLGPQISQQSPVQGYCLVGIHTFRTQVDIEIKNDDYSLRPDVDPVEALPTLRKLIDDHPHSHFFVSCLYTNFLGISIGHIAVFVRSLPKGIDRSFDTNVNNFVNGTIRERNDKLELVIQVQLQEQGLTWISWFITLLVSFLLRFSVSGESLPSQFSKTDRTILPTIQLSGCGNTYHFGGRLQALKPYLPKNYVAHSLHLDSRKSIHLAVRILLLYFAKGGLEHNIIDLTYVIAGQRLEELPERAFATVRIVHAHPKKIALPQIYADEGESVPDQDGQHKRTHMKSTIGTTIDSAGLCFRLFISDPIDATLSQLVTRFSAMSQRSSFESKVNQFTVDAVGQGVIAEILHSSDVFDKAVNEIIHILTHVKVPINQAQLYSSATQSMTGSTISLPVYNDICQLRHEIATVPILSRIDRSDILRYFLASGCNHKVAVIRLVESLTWIGLTFPIDTHLCRVELQNGQFFQQGFDKAGNPVFYFRNMLRGIWRKDENSCIAAILYRLQKFRQEYRQRCNNFRITLVVIMGKPVKPLKVTHSLHTTKATSRDNRMNVNQGSYDEARPPGNDEFHDNENFATGVMSHHHNPRVDNQEHYQIHSSSDMIRNLIRLLTDHFPETLFKAFVVVGHGNKSYTRTALGGSIGLAKYIQTRRTREKVKFLVKYVDLQEYIDADQIPTIAGGRAPVTTKAFTLL